MAILRVKVLMSAVAYRLTIRIVFNQLFQLFQWVCLFLEAFGSQKNSKMMQMYVRKCGDETVFS